VSAPNSEKKSIWSGWIPAATATALLTIAAALVMFSTFMFYDDEGYVLFSLRNFATHGGLYRDVYSQYGPFPFVFYYGLQTLGVPLTHNVGRIITLLAWAGTAWGCGLLVARATRHAATRLAVIAAVFVYLWVMASEPSHPGGLIVLLTTLLAVCGGRWIERDQGLAWARGAAVAVAVLLLTKINIGVFAAFSAVAWLLLFHQTAWVRRWAPLAVAAVGVALPLALMRPLLGTPWVQDFAVTFAASTLALAVAAGLGASGRVGWRALGAAAAAAAVTGALIVSVVAWRGTGARDLLEGLLLGPLKQPVNFSLRYVWPAGIQAVAALSAAGCGLAWYLRRRHAAAVDTAIAVLRLGVAIGLAAGIARYPLVRPDYFAFGWVLPCLWLLVWPLAGVAPAQTAARAWLALLLLGQSLHAFPVPGSQIAWGTVLVIPLAAIGAWEAAAGLAARHAPRGTTWLRPAAGAAAAALAALALFTGWSFAQVATRYREGQNLEMPGAERIRLPDNSAALFRLLTQNAVAYGDMLFSLPGTFSFNLWTGLPAPTLANVTHWFSLLDAGKQQAIIRQLEAHPRACLIVQPGHVRFLAERNLAPKGPLYEYIQREYEPAFAFDDVEFRVRRGRTIRPFLVAEMLTLAPAANAGPGAASSLLRFTLFPVPGRPVASIEVSTPVTGGPTVLHRGNARLEVTPVNVRGEATGPAQATPWPAKLPGPCELAVYYDREKFPPVGQGATIILRDAEGQEVGLARLGR
jgi:hypothetical protein